MGLFNSLLKKGMRAVNSAVADALRGNTNPVSSAKNAECDNRSFQQKLQAVLPNIGEFEVRTNVSPDELEQEAGMSIYTRGGCYARPEALSYVLYQNGQRVLVINLWWNYASYKHVANREIRRYCDNNGIKVLDFFDYLPNEADYMEERIRAQL